MEKVAISMPYEVVKTTGDLSGSMMRGSALSRAKFDGANLADVKKLLRGRNVKQRVEDFLPS